MVRHEIKLSPGDEILISVPGVPAVEISPEALQESNSLRDWRNFIRAHATEIVNFTQSQSFEDSTEIFTPTSMRTLDEVLEQLQADGVDTRTLVKQTEATLLRSQNGNLSPEDIRDAASNFTQLLQQYRENIRTKE